MNKDMSLEDISNEFKSFLENSEIILLKQSHKKLLLDDFYVFPDLRIIKDQIEEISGDLEGEKILEYDNKLIIFGDEQSGKTTLAKRLFMDVLLAGFTPVYMDGKSIKSTDIEKEIKKAVPKIYDQISTEDLLKRDKLICIVDDFSENRLNNRAKRKILKDLDSIFQRVFVFAESSFQFFMSEFPELDDYGRLEILPFGHKRRSQLIEKWVNLDFNEESSEIEYWRRIDNLKTHVDSLVRKNIVPARPLYILMFLQSFETVSVRRLELTSHGHCYQYLIYQALERACIKQSDIDTYLNVLSELGREMLDSPFESLSYAELNEFFKRYSESFIPVDQDKVTKDLVNSFILTKVEDRIRFRYRYLFYFFAAKSLADSLHRGESAKQKIRYLVEKIHLEKASNVILFLTHHSKDPWILDEIIYSIMDIFPEEEEATLEAESLSFLQDFMKDIPALVVENRDARNERLKEDEEKDRVERESGNLNKISDEGQDDVDLENWEDSGRKELFLFIEKINKLFKATEVCGQILRNRIGSLERDSLESIYEESLLVSLRFLNVILKSSEFAQTEAIERIQSILETSPDTPNEEINRRARSFYVGLNYLIIMGVIRRVAFALGSPKGTEIYTKVTENKNTPASRLIQQSIDLQFSKRLDIKKVVKMHNDFSNNPICDRLLKEIILRFCYMHDVGFKDRQRLADQLSIPMSTQRRVLMASKRK